MFTNIQLAPNTQVVMMHDQHDLDFIKAAEFGKLNVIQSLAGLLRTRTTLANEAFLYAAYGGHLAIVEFLVANGADVHYRNEAALRFAAGKNHNHIVHFLVNQGANRHDAIRVAALAGNVNAVKYLFANGCDINDLVLLHSVLQLAAENGHLDITNYLFSNTNGANQIQLRLRICSNV